MPEFKFFCPSCGQHIQCDARYGGSQINCPGCQQLIVVPQTKRQITKWIPIVVVAILAVLFAVIATVWLVRRNAPSVVTFDSFGPGKTYDTSVSWGVGVHFPGYRGQAEWFIPKISGRLSTIEAAIRSANKTGQLNLTISEDDNGVPGKTLESFQEISGERKAGEKQPHAPSTTIVLKSSDHPMLRAGTKYWLCAEPGNDTASWSWAYNNQNLANGFAFERKQGSWEFMGGGPRNGAFSVSVVP